MIPILKLLTKLKTMIPLRTNVLNVSWDTNLTLLTNNVKHNLTTALNGTQLENVSSVTTLMILKQEDMD